VLFVHVGDVGVTSFTSGFASESASKLDSLESGFGFAHWMDGFTESDSNPDSDSANRMRPKTKTNILVSRPDETDI